MIPNEVPVKMSKHVDYGDLFTMEEFIQHCERADFIDYDGHGDLATATHQSNWSISPSCVTDKDFKGYHPYWTHVMWYNR